MLVADFVVVVVDMRKVVADTRKVEVLAYSDTCRQRKPVAVVEDKELDTVVLRIVVVEVVDNHHHHPFRRMDWTSDFPRRDRRVPLVDSHSHRHTMDWAFGSRRHIDHRNHLCHREMHMIDYHRSSVSAVEVGNHCYLPHTVVDNHRLDCHKDSHSFVDLFRF